eukprot:m.10112 g.10112  ORF g.10112 m.10112 type:complete len:50 (-) comp6516_c0_seq1:33-182(-)
MENTVPTNETEEKIKYEGINKYNTRNSPQSNNNVVKGTRRTATTVLSVQ